MSSMNSTEDQAMQDPQKKYWKSLESKEQSAFPPSSSDHQPSEFPPKANVLTNSLDRRDFIKLMGAGAALAGLTSCSVIRRPQKQLFPYTKRPEDVVPGEALFYATSLAIGENVTGLLVEAHEGRPTKIEGNPLHPSSRGKSSALHQASILTLYDPDRTKIYTHKGNPTSKESFKQKWLQQLPNQLQATKGKGLGIVAENTPSPTTYRLLQQLKQTYPLTKIFLYEPIHYDSIREGLQQVTGSRCLPKIDFKKANVVVSLSADFLGDQEPFGIENTQSFTKRRNPDNPLGLNRLYQFESNYTLTGAKADHRYKIPPSLIEPILWEQINQLYKKGLLKVDMSMVSLIQEYSSLFQAQLKQQHATHLKQVINILSKDLLRQKGRCAIVAGRQHNPTVHALVYLLNEWLGNNNKVIRYYKSPFERGRINDLETDGNVSSIKRLASSLKKKSIQNLVIIGGDPFYNAPADINLSELVKEEVETLHLTTHFNQTSSLCDWVAPRSHYLEAWGDLTSLDGVSSICQPLLMPLYDSFSDNELLARFMNNTSDSLALVQSTWTQQRRLEFSKWKQALHNGLIKTKSNGLSATLKPLINLPIRTNVVLSHFKKRHFLYRRSIIAATKQNNSLEVMLHPDYSMYDGRFINNGWLQEMPDPITKISWDNPVVLSHETATRYGVKNNDLVRIEVNETIKKPSYVEGSVYILPGHANDCVSLFYGYGQSKHTGKLAQNSGYNAYTLHTTTSANQAFIAGGKLTKLNKTYRLATVQEHWAIDKPHGSSQNNRPIYIEADLDTYKKHPTFARDTVKVPSLPHGHERTVTQKPLSSDHSMHGNQMSIFPQKNYTEGYQWGLSIDLSQCTGCNACMIACQAENNIPIVGKKQVLEGREMHWIRLDRYFEGSSETPRLVIQPVTCIHCETAPCEQVCPVAATVHSEEGTNDMAYNRCIGTRFCANNCPVKVRRFNFFDYHQTNPQSKKKVRQHLFDLIREPAETIQMQFNPNVTVRMRGVMEKCTYCIQRISKTKIKAKIQNKTVRDGDIQTACEQSCPSGALTFGNINDPNSRVHHLRKHNRTYHLLAELNLKPRTTYLANVRNPHPEIKQ